MNPFGPPPTAPWMCPKCRRPGRDRGRCPADGAYYVTREALEAAGRDAYLGECIGNRYAVLERIGVGGMGAVYRARDEHSGDMVAVKFLRDEYAGHRAIRERFVREAEAGASLDSPHVVRLLDFGVDADRTLYIVMEFVAGWTLRDEVNHNGCFSVSDAVTVARQLLRGLADAHDAGLVHRDLKHDNVMFQGRRGEGYTVRILDFGVAKIQPDGEEEAAAVDVRARVLTAAGAMVGSPSYMSPEQIRGLKVGPPADLYALAVVLYEAMTSRRLFPVNNYEGLLRAEARREAPPLTRTASGEAVPPALDRILQRALALDPADRYPDARSMLLALDQMAAELAAGQLSESPPPCDLLADTPVRREPTPTPVPPRTATPAPSPSPAPVVEVAAAPPRAPAPEDETPVRWTPPGPSRAAAGLTFSAAAAAAFALVRLLVG